MSRADRFDRADFEVRYAQPAPSPKARATEPASGLEAQAQPAITAPQGDAEPVRAWPMQWPIARKDLKRAGESVLADRNGHGRPHKGIDLFADAGTEVRAASDGTVIRVVDGRNSAQDRQRRAGLFVDVRARNALVLRYLHLGESRVEPGAFIRQGTVLGTVASAHTSGLAQAPHVHFEVRQGDFDRERMDYGQPIDPLRLLPPLRA